MRQRLHEDYEIGWVEEQETDERDEFAVTMMRQWMDQGWHHNKPVQDLHDSLSDQGDR